MSSSNSTVFVFNFPFLVGGIGAAAVGSVADEYFLYSGQDNNQFGASTLRTLITPVKIAIRFIIGGFIYVFTDNLILTMVGYRAPYAAGAVTAMCAAQRSMITRLGVFLGCTLGMAAFSQLAYMIHHSYHAKF